MCKISDINACKVPYIVVILNQREVYIMKYSPEELNKLLEEAPKNDKGQPVISDEDFMDNLGDLPKGTRSDSGKVANQGGFVTPMVKGTQRAKEIAAMGQKANSEAWARKRTFKESISILLNHKCDDGQTMQDKIVEAMANKAMDGCVGAAEFLRDTVGEKPSDQVSLDVMTDKDREVLKNLTERLGLNDKS